MAWNGLHDLVPRRTDATQVLKTCSSGFRSLQSLTHAASSLACSASFVVVYSCARHAAGPPFQTRAPALPGPGRPVVEGCQRLQPVVAACCTATRSAHPALLSGRRREAPLADIQVWPHSGEKGKRSGPGLFACVLTLSSGATLESPACRLTGVATLWGGEEAVGGGAVQSVTNRNPQVSMSTSPGW
eukprot:310906-Chlamydomonas_euryale.AAC.4